MPTLQLKDLLQEHKKFVFGVILLNLNTVLLVKYFDHQGHHIVVYVTTVLVRINEIITIFSHNSTVLHLPFDFLHTVHLIPYLF